MTDSFPYMAFKVARASAYVALVPGLWLFWEGWRERYRRVWSALGIAVGLLLLICLLALFADSGSHADGWDVLGTIYWSGLAATVMLVCASAGTLLGKIR